MGDFSPNPGSRAKTRQPRGFYAGGLTATGSNQAAALQLAAGINRISTAAASTGVKLPTGSVGLVCHIIHRGANNLSVYPRDDGNNGQIEALGANNPDTIRPGDSVRYIADSATLWSAT